MTDNLSNSSQITTQEPDTKTSTKSSTKTKILGWVQPHKAPSKPEEVPPKLQEAIDQMNERKAKKLEEMEKNGQKPNSKLSHPVIFDGAGILNGLASGLS